MVTVKGGEVRELLHYTYLGVTLTTKLSFTEHLERKERQAFIAVIHSIWSEYLQRTILKTALKIFEMRVAPTSTSTAFLMPETIRWGIASAGKISNDFVTALKTLPKSEHVVLAVGARNLNDAKEFATKHGIERAYGSYDDIYADSEIDIIYVGTINTAHFSVVMKALEQKKNVVVEKPMAMDLKETELLIACARNNKVFLMEGIWSRCHPAYEYIRSAVSAGEDGPLGEVVRVDACYGSNSRRDRVWKKELGGSGVLDIGIYNIQLALMVLGRSASSGSSPNGDRSTLVPPTQVLSTGCLTSEDENGVDMATSTILTFPGNKYASLTTDLRARLSNEAVIVGTKGCIRLHKPFHSPNQITVNDEVKDFIPQDPLALQGSYNFTNGYFFRYEAQHVRQCLLNGLKESPLLPLDETLLIAKLMEDIRRAAGMKID
ncbi:unnamed protein product [Cyprideis torosa]|uniref:Trans-1,2-dihydrobenzene-1,2-diol dehydrogenase n=1 Tax=Cyprideis torosa TaxID=163714 RepID=A0A7R8WNV0_9CRUS|nr:unnamed protein product [Cyprideis torosa]CAG0900610.1 unnamed protein product [Cyprideis torosa]